MKKNFTINVDNLNIRPGNYKEISLDFDCEDFEILSDFKIEDILNIKNPDVEDVLDHFTMERVLGHYDIDDIVQYCRDQRIDDLIN